MIDLPTWIQAALSALGGTSIVGGIVIATVKAWSKRGESRAREVEAREASATAVVPTLQQLFEEQRREAQKLRSEMEAKIKKAVKESDDRCEKIRKQDREECRKETAEEVERHTAPLRETIVELARETQRTRRQLTGRDDDTGIQALDELVERVSKSDPALPAYRDEVPTAPETPRAIGRLPMVRREIPPPRRDDR